MRAVGFHESGNRVARQPKETAPAGRWPMALGTRLSVDIQPVFASAPVGVVRNRKRTSERGWFATGSKFANRLHPAAGVFAVTRNGQLAVAVLTGREGPTSRVYATRMFAMLRVTPYGDGTALTHASVSVSFLFILCFTFLDDTSLNQNLYIGFAAIPFKKEKLRKGVTERARSYWPSFRDSMMKTKALVNPGSEVFASR